MTMIARITCKKCGNECDLNGCPCAIDYPKITDMSRDAVCKRIKAALVKRSGKQWSVTGGRGTAYGWIRISVPKARLGCARLHEYDWQTNRCQHCEAFRFEDGISGCEGHVCTESCYRAYITPEDRTDLARLLGLKRLHFQGESIPSSTDYYVEYVDRAEGRLPRKHGVPYWD